MGFLAFVLSSLSSLLLGRGEGGVNKRLCEWLAAGLSQCTTHIRLQKV